LHAKSTMTGGEILFRRLRMDTKYVVDEFTSKTNILLESFRRKCWIFSLYIVSLQILSENGSLADHNGDLLRSRVEQIAWGRNSKGIKGRTGITILAMVETSLSYYPKEKTYSNSRSH